MDEVSGVTLIAGGSGRMLKFAAGLPRNSFPELLTALMRDGLEFSLYDPLYLSPSDPGAYFSYRPEDGVWKMTLGNHGWTGGVYEIDPSVLAQQLEHLHRKGLLEEIALDRAAFFAHYAPETVERNRAMNQRLREVHG